MEQRDLGFLITVCDVLVYKALEAVGTWIVKSDRSRYKVMYGIPYFEAHLKWRPTDEQVARVLKRAWDVVPRLLDQHHLGDIDPETLIATLDQYVRDLAITGTAHTRRELEYRLESRLGLRLSEDGGELAWRSRSRQ